MQPRPGWLGLHLPLVPLLGFFVLKRFTKQMDIFMAERLSGPLHAMMSVWLPNSALQIAGRYIILRKPPYGFPCLPFTPTAGPCQKKGMDWVGFWFDLTYGRWELCFHTSLFLGNACFRAPLATVELSLHMPSYSPQPCTYCSIYTVTIVPHHAAPSEQELPGVLAQHNILSSQAKPRSLSLPTLHHLFLVQ